RDARWGRIMEGAGEDPYLGSQMAAAQVRGFQGDYIGAPDHILACVKHFAGYGAAEGGRDYDQSDISDESLWNVYLPPFHAAVKAGAATFMSAYEVLNGVPATGNVWLLRDVLRKDWGFKGAVLSDWDSVKSLQTHGFSSSPADSAVRAATAGVNMEMTSTTYRDHLAAAVKNGQISEATIDALVLPILKLKYQLGLFTNPYVDIDRFKRETGSPEQRKSVREAAEQTAVLLRNENHLLPLSRNVGSLAVIGPLADSKLDTMGSWAIHGDRRDTVTIAQGLRELLPHTRISVTEGVEIERGSPTIFDGQVPPEKPRLITAAEKKAEFNHALELARVADVSVLVLGEAQTMSGENASRAKLSLPGEQEQLLKAISALGKPVVLVLMTGRPLDISWASEHVPAILNVWYPGTEGGHATADLLFGVANPGGHLPVTWPREAGQEPLFYNHMATQNPENTEHRYWDLNSTPLYPFGYGLSYSSFSLSQITVNSPHVRPGTPLSATVTLRNTSKVAGAEVVQLYIHQRARGASRPVRELKAFQKVMLAPGESKEITLTVPAEELSYWSPVVHHQVLDPGTFDVWVGFDSTADHHATFQVTAGLAKTSQHEE
ncbi:MAG: glycoside hydrolase family 3 C-terminal domain-containing protein, partial [Rhodanobacter sp.]